MGKYYQTYLDSTKETRGKMFCCLSCDTHIAESSACISKNFQGRHGRAYLFTNVHNVHAGCAEERQLMTGKHTVADIFCNICGQSLGWQYLKAFEESQSYKENHFIVEKTKVSQDNGWN